MRKILALVICWGMGAGVGWAENLRLAVPEPLVTSGFAKYVVPRFSLKTGVRIDIVEESADAEMRFGNEEPAVFEGMEARWSLTHDGDERAVRFSDWLQSDVGKRTIESFTGPAGETFAIAAKQARVVQATVYDGDAALGEKLSLSLCGRCHVINETNRMNGMGSTPSFAVLRSLQDWDDRFARFFLLNPHPSFTQVEDVSDPFDPTLPPPIVPLEMTQGDLEAILAYVQHVPPADLGAPLQLQ